jgi:hypothetical protein
MSLHHYVIRLQWILLNVVHHSWKLGEWIASLMNTGNCSMSSLTVASLLKLGLRDDRRPSTQHFFLVDLIELDRWVYPHPCWHSRFHTLQGWCYKFVPLETSNFVAIWYVIFPVVIMPHSPKHLVVLLPIFFVQCLRLAPVLCSPGSCMHFVFMLF